MRTLGAGYYTPAAVEAAVRYVCVPDRELIEDGTYLVAELDGRLVGCGGWSLRRKAYAGPADHRTDADLLDPLTEPTCIRAMFTAPDVARRGVGRAILAAAENAARAAGFSRARLGATLSGEAFYRRSGYGEIGRETAALPDGTAFAVVLMAKDLTGGSVSVRNWTAAVGLTFAVLPRSARGAQRPVEFELAGPRGVEANAKHHTIRIGSYEVRPRALDAVGGGAGV